MNLDYRWLLQSKKIIKSIIRVFIGYVSIFLAVTAFGRFISDQIIYQLMCRTLTVRYKGSELVFATPNSMNIFRYGTRKTNDTLLSVFARKCMMESLSTSKAISMIA